MNLYPPGYRIAGRYEVASRPLLGGMGIVYLCFDHDEQRPVALKTFQPEFLPDRAARDRFLREGDTWIKLGRHPHIVRAYQVVRIGDGTEVYLVLELIAKEQGHADASLRSWLTAGKPMPTDQTLLFALQVIRGMQHATTVIPGFVLRDLKPENLLVGSDKLTNANINRLRVTDLGLASVLGGLPSAGAVNENDSASFGRTQLTHGVVGTPLYMPPEQWRGEPVGVTADIYALGCIVFEMLAGERMVEGRSLTALQAAHCDGKRKPMPARMPARLRAWVERCVAVAPSARYASWREVEAALGEVYRQVTGQALPLAEPVEAVGRAERVAAGWSNSEMGASYLDIGKAEVALEYFERARSAGAQEGERRLEAAGLNHLGLAYGDLGDARRAIGYYEQALTVLRAIGDRRGEGNALGNLGSAYKDLGDARRAIGYYEQALTIDREIGDRRGEGADLGNLGSAYARLGDARRAIGYYEQALVIHREIGDRRGEGAALGNLGSAYADLGDARRAIGYYEQALVIHREIGDISGEASDSFNTANLYRQQGNTAQALPLAQHALALFRKMESPYAERAEQLIAVLQGRAPAPSSGPSAEQIRQQFAPLVAAVVAAARGSVSAKQQVEQVFDKLTQGGWRIVEPIQRIWKGERDESELTAGIDSNSALIVREILKQLKV